MKKLLMELLGTFFFVLTIVVTGNAMAIASMLMAWLYIGSYVSGAHYNPMLSLAIALSGHLKWREFLYYVAAQVGGAFLAFLMASFLRGSVAIPVPQVTVLQAFVAEVLLAFVLASVVLYSAVSKQASHVYGIVIGFSIPALVLVGGPVSGGVFNPAIALGGALFGIISGMGFVWINVVMYVGAAFLGAYLAALAYHYFLPASQR